MARLSRMTVLFVLICVTAGLALSQVSREDGVNSIAGLLESTFNDYTFTSIGGEILFASIDSEVYQTRGRGSGGCEEEMMTASEGGCDCGDEGGGPGGLCLQVISKSEGGGQDELLCWAGRPNMPGWQRDPRLACLLPPSVDKWKDNYVLRVKSQAGENSCGSLLAVPHYQGFTDPNSPGVAYLLNVSIRKIPDSSNLSVAIGQSSNPR